MLFTKPRQILIYILLMFCSGILLADDRTVALEDNKEINAWENGYSFSINLKNTGQQEVLSWSGVFYLPETESLSGNLWGAAAKKDITVEGMTRYIVHNGHSYSGEGTIKPGGSVLFGGTVHKPANSDPGMNGLAFEGVVPQPPMPGPGFPSRTFAPYVDVMLYPTFSLQNIHQTTGQKFFTLAFITADDEGTPAWGGTVPISSFYYAEQINTIRELGGDVILSFGGANGTPLAAAIRNVDDLVAAYESVIKNYRPGWIDFDVEGIWVSDKESIDRRNEALAMIRARYPKIKIAYVLPILPTGLTVDGLYVLKSAKNVGVEVDVVNAMAMDFGSVVAPPSAPMSHYINESAIHLHAQLRDLYPHKNDAEIWAMIGITPMIGQNDVRDEVVYEEDAQAVADFAEQHQIGFLAMWSANRDNGTKRDENASPSHSGIVQKEFAFTDIFKLFSGDR